MTPHQESGVYVNGDFSEPITGQHNFQQQYDLSNPMSAMTSYARTMHQHTQKQMDSAARSARRRPASDTTMSGLTPESSNSSVQSTMS
ncbi:MAG: hypothetical protein M1819_002935 [Sarea resinae]|nr:MAG: hypothetical protein M1819_002935 [Sarea resinae]